MRLLWNLKDFPQNSQHFVFMLLLPVTELVAPEEGTGVVGVGVVWDPTGDCIALEMGGGVAR